jgi:hypothetical protein
MTKGVGYDKYWDVGGGKLLTPFPKQKLAMTRETESNPAVTPDVAAKSLSEWVNSEFGMAKTGQYWAPRGAA